MSSFAFVCIDYTTFEDMEVKGATNTMITYTLKGKYQHEEGGGRIYDRYVAEEHLDEWVERIFHGILPESHVRITIEVGDDA